MHKKMGNLLVCLVLLFAAVHQVYRVLYYEGDAFNICIAIGFWLAVILQVGWMRGSARKDSPSAH